MKKITTEELMEKIAEHQKWLRDKTTGKCLDASFLDFSDVNFYKIDFHGANFHDADFRDANFHGANFRDANFIGAIFHDANFHGANFRDAIFHGANFRNADFCDAYFRDANFHGANFHGANFIGANFRNADFIGANFRDADFIGANFCDANFCDANFYGANFCDADFIGANNINEVISFANIANTELCMQCPEEGSFIGFKKAAGGIVKLRVTESAKRYSATTHKCRCSEAEVLEIQNMDGTKSERTSVSSKYDRNFIYSVGEIVSVPDFDDDRWNECARGIHFFMSRQEAVNY